MISFKVEITPNNIAERFVRLQAALPERIEQERKRLADIVLREIKDQTPVRTGALRDSLHWVSAGKVDILWGLYYGEYVIVGTRPHEIRPKKAKALRFEIDGQVVFAKRVRHPGTKPNDFRKKGLKQASYNEVLQDLADWIKGQVAG